MTISKMLAELGFQPMKGTTWWRHKMNKMLCINTASIDEKSDIPWLIWDEALKWLRESVEEHKQSIKQLLREE